jgi:GNAT superfamily N-acetyltransferase
LTASILDNPVWSALEGPHQDLAVVSGNTRWYPSDVAPFIAVPSSTVIPELDRALARGWSGQAFFVGVCPTTLPAGWRYVSLSQILQLLPPIEADSAAEDLGSVLGAGDHPQMLDLAQAAFPDFFRTRTPELGVYLGVYDRARLVAMAGERLSLPGFQEISGVCTHPEFSGRGYASRLTSALLGRHRLRGVQSFLHVSEGNLAARRIYDSMGFRIRASLLLGKIERLG